MDTLLLSSVFFFKQKTAYERRISDWSSDVCSSDLPGAQPLPVGNNRRRTERKEHSYPQRRNRGGFHRHARSPRQDPGPAAPAAAIRTGQYPRRLDRKSVV